jgi:acetylornithine deacetylase/succinyl-diaminopimelate desuccinylase-like protein
MDTEITDLVTSLAALSTRGARGAARPLPRGPSGPRRDGARHAGARAVRDRAHSHPFVGAIEEAAAAVLGASPSIKGAGYWADSAFITAAGIPTVLSGPVGGGAHANEERVDPPSVAACRTTLADLARAFCTG